MTLSLWISLVSICLLGAVSPGPSLAVVMNSTLRSGRAAGIACAVSHGFGVALYGLLTVAGLALIITRTPIFLSLQFLGALYLIYLGVKSLRSTGNPALIAEKGADEGYSAVLNGFLVAFLNPKLAIFMLALFSQFLQPDTDWIQKWIMVATVGITDMLWYALVVTLVSREVFLRRLRSSAAIVDRIFGAILILLATTVLWHTLRAAFG